MAHENIEIELKFPLKNTERVRAFLNKHATPEKDGLSQKDTYYVPAHRDFLAPRYPFEWLRLRETPKGASVNYKHFYPENAEETDYCDEFETPVDRPEAIEQIFAAIDIKPIVVVSKTRSTWAYKGTEVAIDRIEGLGDFIELESMAPFSTPQAAKAHLRAILAEIGGEVGPEDLRGYPYLLLERDDLGAAQK